MKRGCLFALVFVLLCNIFSPVAPTAAHPEPATTITIWHQWDGAYLTAILAVFDQYEADHPGVVISLAKPYDMQATLRVAIPSGSGPDIIAWASDQIGNLVKQNFILDLDQLGVTPLWLSSTYEPAAVAGVTYLGKIWAIPEYQEGIALVYNKDLVSSTYLPAFPYDFTDLREKAQAFLSDTKKPLICNQGFPGGDAYHIAPVFFGFGVPGYIDELGNANLNTPEAISAGIWLSTMPSLSPASQDFTSCQNALITGNVGMWWTGWWALGAIEKAGLNYGIAAMGRPFVGLRDLMVSSNAQDRGNASLALDIIQYFTNTANSKAITLANKTMPANSAALNDPAVQALPAVAGFSASTHNGVPMSPSPFANCQWGPVGDAVTAIWKGQLSPAAALDLAQSQIKACIYGLQKHVFIPVLKK